MDESKTLKEFDIFGHKVRFRPDQSAGYTADEVIELLNNIGEEVDPDSKLEKSKRLLLVALKIAADKVLVDKNFQEKLSELEGNVSEVIEFVTKLNDNQNLDSSTTLN